MNKILITADIHFGVPNRLQDIVWAARVMREYAHRNDINIVLVLGDLFHDRRALEIDALCAAYDFFTECKESYNQSWVTFPGNHDMYLKHSWKINSLKTFSHLLTIIDGVKILQLNDVRFWILPFIHLESAYMRVLKKIEERASPDDILLTHIGVFSTIKNVCFLLKDWSTVSFHNSSFKQIYTGHFHATQQVGHNLWYPGSPIPFKFDEGDIEHGFFVYDLDTRTHEFIDIWEYGLKYYPDETPPPNYITVPESEINNISRSIIEHNIIRIATSGDLTPNERLEAEETLSNLGAASVRWLNISAEDTYRELRNKLANHEPVDIFESWLKIDKANNANLDLDLLRKLHHDIVVQADESYTYTVESD